MAEDDDEPEIEISDERDSVPLSVAGVPVIISIGQVSAANRCNRNACAVPLRSWVCATDHVLALP